MPDTATNVIEAARKVFERAWPYQRGYLVDGDPLEALDVAIKAYDAERSQPASKPDWSMKFEDCGPDDPGAIQFVFTGGADTSWKRMVE